MDIRIADVDFSIACDKAAAITPPPPAYRQFLQSDDVPVDSVKLHMELNNLPDTGTMNQIFDNSQAWAVFRHEDSYLIEYRPPALSLPLWVARFDTSIEDVTVHLRAAHGRDDNEVTVFFHPFFFPLGQILLMHILARRGGAIIHAAGGSIFGKGYLFPGRSGAGKSTLSRLLTGNDRISMFSDDRIVVRTNEDGCRMYGTPWPGDAGIAENRSCPLSGMFFIRHAAGNSITDIKPVEAMERLMPVTSIPWYDRETMSAVLDFCEGLASSVPAYELCFRPDGKVVELLEKFVTS